MRLFTNSLGSASSTIHNVIITAGQSNATGSNVGVNPPAEYYTPNANAKIMGNLSATTINTFEVMDYLSGNFLGNEFGAEPSIAYNFGTTPVYFVKVSLGSTNLAVDWASGSTLRDELIRQINQAKTYFTANNINVRYTFYWNQWESDVSSYSATYDSNYQSFITEVLSSTGITFHNHIIAKVNKNSNFYLGNVTKATVIESAQYSHGTLYGATVLDLDDLMTPSLVHYSGSELITIGNRIYDLL